jgi:uncharacterized protein (DUF736 family)
MKKSALIIGAVTKAENGVFTGKIETLAIKATITLQPNANKEKDSHPDFIVLRGQNEISVAWERNDQWGTFIFIPFEEPSLAPGSYRLQKSGSRKALRSCTESPSLRRRRKPEGPARVGPFIMCAEHVRQLEGESPFHNLMEVK